MTELQYLDAGLGCSWDATLVEPLADLNAEILEAYAGGAPDLQALWQPLSGASRQLLARCPYLLADAGFAQTERWEGLPAAVHDAAAADLPRPPQAVGRAPFTTPLIRRVLVFAWHLARARPLAARIALGMSSACAARVAGCRLADLEALAEQRPAWIRVRWHDRPELWRAWLRAAGQGSSGALLRLQLWGLQSLAAAMVERAAAHGQR